MKMQGTAGFGLKAPKQQAGSSLSLTSPAVLTPPQKPESLVHGARHIYIDTIPTQGTEFGRFLIDILHIGRSIHYALRL